MTADQSTQTSAMMEAVLEAGSAFNTPAYVYSVEKVKKNYLALKDALKTDILVSLKANSCQELLQRSLHFLEDGFEVASLEELKLLAGCRRPIFINSPCWPDEFIVAAIRSRAGITFDNLSQVSRYVEMLTKYPRAANTLALRINPWLYGTTSENDRRRKHSHFGMDKKSALAALDIFRSSGLAIEGIHLFVGSYRFHNDCISLVQTVGQVITDLRTAGCNSLQWVNLGGGFTDAEFNPEILETYRSSISGLPSDIELRHESGRAIFASAGLFITRVVAVKSLVDVDYIVCDGGIAQNFLLARTESAIKKYAKPAVISNRSGHGGQISNHMKFVGASCNPDDIIGEIKEQRPLPSEGDYVVFDNCGAYNASYTVSGFLSLPKAETYVY